MTRFGAALSIGQARVRPRCRSGRVSIALASGLALLGCATTSIERVAAPAHRPRVASLDEVLTAYDAYCAGLETLSASGDLELKDLRAGKRRKLGIRLVAARGSRLYLKGSFLLVTALEVVSNGARFWFQVPSKQTVWTGAADAAIEAEGADHAPYYALRPNDVTAALLPEPLQPAAGESLALEADQDTFCLTLARLDESGRGVVRRRVCVDRESLKPARARSYDARGELVSEVSFGAYMEGTPRRLVVTRPTQGYVAEFALAKVVLNQPAPERAFQPRTPPAYKLIEVGQR